MKKFSLALFIDAGVSEPFVCNFELNKLWDEVMFDTIGKKFNVER